MQRYIRIGQLYAFLVVLSADLFNFLIINLEYQSVNISRGSDGFSDTNNQLFHTLQVNVRNLSIESSHVTWAALSI